MSTIKLHIWAWCVLSVIFPTFFAMILIKQFSLASRFYISEWNLPCKILETLCKKMTRKTMLNVYYTFSVNISLILYNNWDRMILKITVSCSPNLIVILCSHLWKMSSKCFILRGSQIMMNFVSSKLKSLFDNFNHISNWPSSLKNTCKRLYNI